MKMLFFHPHDQDVVDSFETDRFMFEDLWNMVPCGVNIRITENNQRANRGTENQMKSGPQDRDAGCFGAGERPSDIEPLLWQQIIEIVPGDSSGNLWITLPN